MNNPKQISIEHYDYPLPEEKIAKYPLEKRDESKLLFYKYGHIASHVFNIVPDLLPDDTFLIFNETKVVHARLPFRKNTGASIELFILEPDDMDMQTAFGKNTPVRWKCLVGNAKKWKSGPLYLKLENGVTLKAENEGRKHDAYIIKISSDSTKPFSELLSLAGEVPLPPYLKRKPTGLDKLRYQTVFARHDGSVAAPTAGLHFTEHILQKIRQKNIASVKVTLHVGAGTFKPVIEKEAGKHTMHTEQMVISKKTIRELYEHADKRFTPVGTTSVRTLESLYWYGVKIAREGDDAEFNIPQWYPYINNHPPLTRREALKNVINRLNQKQADQLRGQTRLMIVPGYKYHMTDAMFTNFHQPKSTLLLLVSAFVGNDWKKIYRYALENRFRFLSYGDSCYFLT
ncbi:MAG: S-adenosylmethionine:tRNA ribosyltransferase-isomerase [Bacteroidota bacterium]